MNKWIKGAALGVAVTFVVAPAGIAAKAKKPVKKPAAKKTTIPHVVQGTTQLKGEYAEFGKTYTLGKSDPLNINIKSAEYTVQPITIGENTYTANAEEKLLVLHMTYHNPRSSECFVRYDTFGFTVVDPKDQNHDSLQDLASEKDSSAFSAYLKPAQKVDVYGVMKVPAEAQMPKLIIKGSDDLVLRYDLKGKVKGLSAPYADSSDSTGATALAKIAATPGTTYPIGYFNFKLNKVEYISDTNVGDTSVEEGEKFLVVSFSIKNISKSQQFYRYDSFPNKIIDADGIAAAECCYDVYQASKFKAFSGYIQPAQELNLRYVYKVPADTTLKTYAVSGPDEGRTFEYDISGVK